MVCGVPALQSIDWHDGSVQYPITHYLHVSSLLLTRTHTTSRASLWMTIFDLMLPSDFPRRRLGRDDHQYALDASGGSRCPLNAA